MRKPKRHTLRNIDDLAFEARMPPFFGDTFDVVPENELEEFFINSANKHGVIDEMFSDRFMEDDWG